MTAALRQYLGALMTRAKLVQAIWVPFCLIAANACQPVAIERQLLPFAICPGKPMPRDGVLSKNNVLSIQAHNVPSGFKTAE